MEKFFETNKKTILTLAGIGAAAALIALVFKNAKKTKAEKETPIPVRKESTSHLFGLTKEEKASAIGSINIEYEGHHLSTRTMQQIIDAIRIFAQPKYLELVKENRLNRRAKKDALEQYIACWYDFNTKVDEIITKSEKEILREINVPEAVYNDSTEYHKNKQDNEIALARVFLQSKLKGEQKSTKTISLEELREILKSQIEFAKKEAENRELIAGKLNNPVETASLIGTQILDHLYSKYTVEEEDIQAALLVHGADAHVQELSMELQSAILMLTADEPSQAEQ